MGLYTEFYAITTQLFAPCTYLKYRKRHACTFWHCTWP